MAQGSSDSSDVAFSTLEESSTVFSEGSPAHFGAPVKHVDLKGGSRTRTPFKVFGIVLAIVVVVAVLVYAAGVVVFTERFFPNTVVGKVDVSMKTSEEAQQLLEASVEDYTLSVKGQGFSLELTSEDAGLALGEQVVESMMSHVDPWRWPFEVFRSHDETASLLATYTQSGIDEKVRAAIDEFNAQVKAPQDAYATFDEAEGRFVVVPEEAGTTLSADAVIALAEEALVSLQTSVEVTSDQLEQPSVLSTDSRLLQAVDTANGFLLTDVDFTLSDTVVASLDASTVWEWVVFGEDLSVTLDKEALSAWVDEVADSCTTYQTTRSYTRADGKQITVSGGSYGWSIDTDGFVTAVCEAVEAGQTESVEIPCTRTAGVFNGIGERDWGSRYVDVDLSEQHARFYDESGDLIWESDIVSGAIQDDGSSLTPTGVYAVTGKQSPCVLRGSNSDGTTYESNVSYWMPFVGNSIGLHDATWQSSFGGTRWKDGAGSHGCVNLPLSSAAELYDLIKVGDTVVVHW